MIRLIGVVSLKDPISMTDLLLCLGLISINGMLHFNWLRFHERFLCMDDDAYSKKATMHYTDGPDNQEVDHKRGFVM